MLLLLLMLVNLLEEGRLPRVVGLMLVMLLLMVMLNIFFSIERLVELPNFVEIALARRWQTVGICLVVIGMLGIRETIVRLLLGGFVVDQLGAKGPPILVVYRVKVFSLVLVSLLVALVAKGDMTISRESRFWSQYVLVRRNT
jgi:hypothetical protein